MKIKNIDNLKDIQIFCREEKDVKNCLNYLEQLGFKVFYGNNKCRIICYSSFLEGFKSYTAMNCSLENCFYNKKFIKTLQKLIKEKEEKEKEKVKDFEVAENGRITKINNEQSKKQIFVVYDEAYNYDYEYYKENGMKIVDMAQNYLDFIIKYGIAYETKEARDKAMFKLEIETKLKNIAERLNDGMKIDWDKGGQCKYFICYDFEDYGLCQNCDTKEKYMGQIYCLNIYFLEVAKKEIGEENLIKYFKE